MYILVLIIFVGSIGGLIFYKLSYKFLLPKNISYILGGVVSFLLSYQVVIFHMTQDLLFGVLIALVFYILFIILTFKYSDYFLTLCIYNNHIYHIYLFIT